MLGGDDPPADPTAPARPAPDEPAPDHPFLDPDTVRRLVDDGMVLFLAIDGRGRIEWVGQSCRAVLGREPDDLVGTPALSIVHPDDLALVADTLDEDAREAHDRILAVVRVARADGSWATLEFGGIDLRDPDGAGRFLAWGRSYEASTRLLLFLGSLLESADLPRLLDEVVRWSDVLAPHGHTALVVEDAFGRRVVAAGPGVPTALADGLVDHFDGLAGRPAAAPAIGLGTPVPAALDGPTEVAVADLAPALALAVRSAGMHALWLVPIGEPGAPARGVVVVGRTRPGPVRATHARHYAQVATLARLALAWSSTHTELQAAATTDPLTGVANRAQLGRAMAEARTGPAALLLCDLDDFKAVNDRHGHIAGDRVLLAVAARLAGTARPGDLLVRLGGDEFAVWCPGLDDRGEAERLAGSVVGVLDTPVVVEGMSIRVGGSVGVVLVEGPVDDPAAVDQVLGRADRALYRAKREGKGRWAADELDLG